MKKKESKSNVDCFSMFSVLACCCFSILRIDERCEREDKGKKEKGEVVSFGIGCGTHSLSFLSLFYSFAKQQQ